MNFSALLGSAAQNASKVAKKPSMWSRVSKAAGVGLTAYNDPVAGASALSDARGGNMGFGKKRKSYKKTFSFTAPKNEDDE